MMPDVNELFPQAAAVEASGARAALPLAILLDTHTLLVVGVGDVPPPAAAKIAFTTGDHPAEGRWQSLAWADPSGEGGHAFIAVVRAERAAELHAVAFALDGEDRTAVVALPGFDRLELDIDPLVAWLGSHGGEPSRIFDFVRGTLATPETSQPCCEPFLIALLTAISDHDGCIEIIAEPEEGGILVQGWAMHLPATSLPLILLNGALSVEEAAVAHFHRSDLLPTAKGFVAAIRCVRPLTVSGLRHLFFHGGDRYFRLDVVEHCGSLGSEQVPRHLREMMGGLEGPIDSLSAMKQLCLPGNCDHEAASVVPAPVRIACDLAVHVPGAGLFLTGWLLDPKRLTERVVVKTTGDFHCRIDETMVRTARPDLNDGFRSNALFAKCLQPWDTLHGFMAFVPRKDPIAVGEAHYLGVVLTDGRSAFLPLHFDDGDGDALVQQILAGVDLDAPEIERLIGDHLSPLVAGLAAAARRPGGPACECTFGATRGPAGGSGAPMRGSVPGASRPSLSVIVPLGDDWSDFDVNLAQFAAEPDFAMAELIVVAARPSAGRIVSRLRRSAEFYRLHGRLLLSSRPCDRLDALALGAASASAEHLLLLAPTVLPMEPGWLTRLLGEFAPLPDGTALCPTLLYEDHSIHYAGGDAPSGTGEGLVTGGLTGHAAAAIAGSETRPVWTGVLDCCCIGRSTFLAACDGPASYLSARLRSLDFALRLGAAGGQFHWAPALALYALDEDECPQEPHWQRVHRLVEERCFESTWGAALAAAADRQG